MNMTIGCPIPGASQPKEPVRIVSVSELKKRAMKVMFRDVPECGEFDAISVDDIDCMPTIDPETLRPTAEWGDDKNSPFYVCSACRSPSFTRSKFCKECGAKMVNPKSYEKVTQQRMVNGDANK